MRERLLPGAKRVYFGLLDTPTIRWLLLRRKRNRHAVRVLNLHGVSPEANAFYPPLHPDAFDRLLSFLARTCHVTTIRGLAQPRPDNKPLVVLSFDDGRADFVEYAMPLLEKHGIKANQNVIGCSIETGELPWSLALNELLDAAPRNLLSDIGVPGVAPPIGQDALALQRFAARLFHRLETMGMEARTQQIAAIEALLGRYQRGRQVPMMSMRDVQEAVAAGHEIGCHSYSHESMANVGDEFFLADLARCRATVAQLGGDARIYAFPNGSYTPRHIDLLAEQGVDQVLLVDERLSTRSNSVHPRLTVRGATQAELHVRALGLGRAPSFRRPTAA